MDFFYPANSGRDLNFWKSTKINSKPQKKRALKAFFLVAVAQVRMIVTRGNNEKPNTVLIF